MEHCWSGIRRQVKRLILNAHIIFSIPDAISEADIMQKIMGDVLRSIIPQFYGVTMLNNVEFIRMEHLTQSCPQSTSIMDVKVWINLILFQKILIFLFKVGLENVFKIRGEYEAKAWFVPESEFSSDV